MAGSTFPALRRAVAVAALLGQLAVSAQVLGPGNPAAAAPPDAVGSGRLVTVTPRLIAQAATIPANGTVTLDVDQLGAGAAGAAVTVSARSDAAGTLAAYPADVTAPVGVALDLNAGRWSRGAGIVGVDGQGRFSLTNRTGAVATVSVEVGGYLTATPDPQAGALTPIGPVRVAANLTVPANGAATVTPAGSGLPTTGVTALALAVSATATAAGQLTVHPAGSAATMPQLELVAGQPATAHALVRPGAAGALTVTNTSTAPVTVDLYANGYYAPALATAPGLAVVPIPPARVRDALSVSAFGTVDVPVAGVAGVAGVPGDAGGVCLVLHTEPTSTRSVPLTVYPTGASRPNGVSATTLPALRAGVAGYVRLGTNGSVRVYNGSSVAARVALDVTCHLRNPRPIPAPTNVTATGGDGYVAVAWTPSASDAPLSQYTVTASPGGRTVTAAGNTAGAIVAGLTNGTAYTFTVVAHSGTRQSPPSVPTSPTTPGPPPTLSAPFVTYVYPRDSAVRVSWAAPPDGADSVTGYRVRAVPGGQEVTVAGTVTETVVTGLTNGTAYRFTVTAANANGTGATSFPSEYVTPYAADVPLRPAGLLTVALDRRVDVQWVAPVDGGAPITGYTVTAEPGGHRVAVPADTTVTRVDGLTNGTAYTVRVTATNKAGTGEAAEATVVRPSASRAPDAPVDLRASVLATGTVEVAWAPPVDVGTSAITSYRVIADPGGATVTATGPTARIGGLDPATGYTFTVTATNAAGTGPAATTSRPVRPALQIRTAPRTLTPAELGTLAAVEGDSTLVFADPPASLTALRNGTILAVPPQRQAPRGLLRTVTALAQDGNLLRVSTRQTPLTDVFAEGELNATTNLGDSDVEDLLGGSPGLRRKQPTIGGRTLDQGARRAGAGVDIGIRDGHFIVELNWASSYQGQDPLGNAGKAPPVGGKFELQLDLDPEIDNSISVSLTDGVRSHHRNLVIMKAEFRGKVGVLLDRQFEWGNLGLKVPCVTVPVGPVPVVVCPELGLAPALDLQGSFGLSGAVGIARTLGAEMVTHNGVVTATNGINDSYAPARYNLDPYGDGSITFAFRTTLVVYLYNTAGPGLSLRPYIQGRFDTTQNPWWELRLGITIGVFLESREFFGKKIEFRRDDLVNFFLTIAQADGPFRGLTLDPEKATVQPGQPQQFRAAATGWPGGAPVTWRVVSGPGGVTADGVFVSPLAGLAVVEARSDAGVLGEMTGRAQVLVDGVSVPSPPLEPRAASAPSAADVSWQPPETDGRSPITDYAVVTLPDGPTTYVPGDRTSVRIGGLTPFRPYQFTVYAVNASGRSAASLPTAPVVPTAALRPDGDVFNVAVDPAGIPDSTRVAGSQGVAVSGDGRYVVFGTSVCSNLAPPEVRTGCAAGGNVLLRKDLVTGELRLASRQRDGRTPATFVGAASFDVNRDGNRVLFVRTPEVPTGQAELLVHDLDTGTTAFLGLTAGRYPQGMASPVRMIRDGLGAVYSVGALQGEALYLATGPGEPTLLPCPRNADNLFPCNRFDVDEAGATVVLASAGQAYRIDVASGTRTLLNPETEEIERIHTSLNHIRISRDGTAITCSWMYTDPGDARDLDGLARAPAAAAAVYPTDVVLPNGFGRRHEPIGISADGRTILYQQLTVYDLEEGDHLRVLDADRGDWYDVAAGLTPDRVDLADAELADNGSLVVLPYDDEEDGAVLAQRLR
ncbi:fibronectin type III domain-containing protein [Plantactinospora endophytica]|uniref:Fibronectin type-III domain-containing protein n=1 Tax=Plantactinospora endophytica TaxID=673535 RepID=A0ABQ4E0N7_9ACTN|nr:fibronectin type III domain-containing protein [Plantactinospora endophytica]GIG88268.1 hypothetical protein Pen02_32040 [Plantactinospora endophytica]